MLTQEKLKESLKYNPNTGLFTWIKLNSNNRCSSIGSIAGGDDGQGYITICVNGERYKAHRLAYCFMHGYEPEFIDHVNHDKKDNRIINLRDVSRRGNSLNRGIAKNNTSGITGVGLNKNGKWTSQIMVNGKTIILGSHAKKSTAVTIRKAAEGWYGFHENHGI